MSKTIMIVLVTFVAMMSFVPLLHGNGGSIDNKINVELGFIGGAGYERAVWNGPDGSFNDSSAIYRIGLEARVYKPSFWARPTVKLEYGWTKFDFSNTEKAPIRYIKPQYLSGKVGLSKELKPFNFKIDVYALLGAEYINFRPKLLERYTYNGRLLLHDGKPDTTVFVLDVGVEKTWKIGIGEIGLQVGTNIYPSRPSFDRCSKAELGNVMPYVGGVVRFNMTEVLTKIFK